jgi:hypothetical protein
VDSFATGRDWFRRHRREECRAAAVGRARPLIAELASLRARGRQLETIPTPESAEQAAAPRRTVRRFVVGNSRLATIKEVVVAEPPARDRWGGPIR